MIPGEEEQEWNLLVQDLIQVILSKDSNQVWGTSNHEVDVSDWLSR
jgi:hypothetical protein